MTSTRIPGRVDLTVAIRRTEGGTVLLQITPSERIALQLLANGIATTELAVRLGLSEWEIEAQLATLFARLGAVGRAEAIAAAFRRGLLISDDQRHESHSANEPSSSERMAILHDLLP
jgi:DNA-binding CsgD family transcriptional regulator